VHAAATAVIAQLAHKCSIEINVHDLKDLEASRAVLPRGKKLYVSHLPTQTWQETKAACGAVVRAGFDPVPHLPVRRIAGVQALDGLLATLAENAGVREVLLIAGDCSQPAGPYSSVADVLRTGVLNKHGFRRVSLAAHPEGHPTVPIEEIRRAEREKAMIARELDLEATFVTQFFFESVPFLNWIRELRAAGITSRVMAGLAGPARIAALVKYAVRCGIGTSIRALAARRGSTLNLIADHGPQEIMRTLARELGAGTADFSGIHFFCFGGYLRTSKWLYQIERGQFSLTDDGGFDP
jgi:methylenetetrahydrofolate reductase (NADPH)